MSARRGRQARPPDSEYRERFGVALRNMRQDIGLSQDDLADKAGMSRRYIGSIERGEVAPTLDRIVLLARTLSVDPGLLLPTLQEQT